MMSMVDPDSLAETLDALEEVGFFGLTMAMPVRKEAAKWIAARVGGDRSYRGMPAPTTRDYAGGVRLFTGERVTTGAGTGHVLGQEACRALVRLDVPLVSVREDLARGQEGMARRFTALRREPGFDGRFCCATCTVAVWRHASTGGFPAGAALLPAGLRWLKERRDGTGRWAGIPFWYALLALADIERRDARAEMRYASPVLERVLARRPKPDRYDRRRRLLAERTLAAV